MDKKHFYNLQRRVKSLNIETHENKYRTIYKSFVSAIQVADSDDLNKVLTALSELSISLLRTNKVVFKKDYFYNLREAGRFSVLSMGLVRDLAILIDEELIETNYIDYDLICDTFYNQIIRIELLGYDVVKVLMHYLDHYDHDYIDYSVFKREAYGD